MKSKPEHLRPLNNAEARLDQALRRRGIKTVILGGIATNFGVESTRAQRTSTGMP